MDHFKNQYNDYFQDALSDFMHDAASGRAIRHLVDVGYTTAQIMKELDYPTPFEKVRHTVTRYLKESGILLNQLPDNARDMRTLWLGDMTQEALFAFLAEQINRNGEENSYISCPFGMAIMKTDKKAAQALSMLTAREREYLDGIDWGEKRMYHRLNRRMLEIGAQIAKSTEELRFYFLKSGEEIYSSSSMD